MSRSILIVICDFLLLSLLSLANFDKPASLDNSKEALEIRANAENKAFADAQMVELLKMSLDNEREKREALRGDVEKLSVAAQERLNQTQKQKKIIEAHERQLAQMRQTKASLEKERQDILEKSAALEKRVNASEMRNEALSKEIMAASAKLDKSAQERIALQKQIGDMRQTDSATKMKLEAVQEELRQNKENLERLRAESDSLKRENKAIETEKIALATKLEVATTKTQIYEENLRRAQALVDIEKTEKTKILLHADKLASNVGELSTNQKELSKEVRDLRPKTPPEIFETVISPNLVTLTLTHTRGGIMGVNEVKNTYRLAPVKLDGKYWLIFSVNRTVLMPVKNDYFPPKSLSAEVSGESYRFEPQAIYATSADNSIIAVQVPKAFIEKEKITPLEPAENYFRFNECVVVSSREKYHGQTPFRSDFKDRKYAKLDVGLFQSLFSEFSPTAGDVMLSRGGEFLGTLTKSDTALLMRTFPLSMSLDIGKDYTPEKAKSFVMRLSK